MSSDLFRNVEGYPDPTAGKAINRITAEEYNAKLEANMSEDEHQIRLFAETRRRIKEIPELALLYHIPNGGQRSEATGGRLKAMGVKSGVPDMHLPVARHGLHGLYVELKSFKKGAKLEPPQKQWLHALNEQGYATVVCYGWRDALNEIMRYLGCEQ